MTGRKHESAELWSDALDETIAKTLPAFLPARRWFAGKARHIESASIVDVASLPSDPSCAVLLARIDYDAPPAETYALMLRSVGPSETRLATHGETAIAEASTDATAWKALLQGFARGSDVPTLHGGALRFGDAGANAIELASQPLDGIRPLGKEQSNTSMRIGATRVAKLFRKLENGEHPELEIGRFLMKHTRFRAFPALRGSIVYQPDRGAAVALVVVQDFLESQADGWTFLLDELEAATSSSAVPREILEQMEQLGRVTGEFHAALATRAGEPDFDPQPAEPRDREVWIHSLARRAERALDGLRRQRDSLPERARALADAVASRWSAHLAYEPPAITGAGSFDKIRVHGDYHLGQTLATRSGFVLMDFEGEPARSLAERRARHCALKDVAGMLRSFDYAVETVRGRLDAPSGFLSGGGHAAVASLCTAFLSGYEGATFARGAAFLPSDRAALRGWIDFFELDKAMYEIEYELAQRPDWLAIPLAGVDRILARSQR